MKARICNLTQKSNEIGGNFHSLHFGADETHWRGSSEPTVEEAISFIGGDFVPPADIAFDYSADARERIK